jgi:hypothetical protein
LAVVALEIAATEELPTDVTETGLLKRCQLEAVVPSVGVLGSSHLFGLFNGLHPSTLHFISFGKHLDLQGPTIVDLEPKLALGAWLMQHGLHPQLGHFIHCLHHVALVKYGTWLATHQHDFVKEKHPLL